TGSVTNDVTTIAVTCEYTEGNLLTSAPLPSYAPGTGELAVFESINAARLGGGFGALIQNSALDMAAAAHAHYLAEHFYESSAMLFDVAALSSFTESDLLAVRAESVGMSGFTGEDPPARALAAGYGSPTVLEGAAFTV